MSLPITCLGDIEVEFAGAKRGKPRSKILIYVRVTQCQEPDKGGQMEAFALNAGQQVIAHSTYTSSTYHPGTICQFEFDKVRPSDIIELQLQFRPSIAMSVGNVAQIASHKDGLPPQATAADACNRRIKRTDIFINLPEWVWESGYVIVSNQGEFFHHRKCPSLRALKETNLRYYPTPEDAWEGGYYPHVECLYKVRG